MAVTVNTNVSAMTAERYLNKATRELNTAMERLSSGSRINSAKADAAGLQISNRLITQIQGLDVAMRNASDGISIAQTAEGAMQESTKILQRIRDLALQAANGSNGLSERVAIQDEVGQLEKELDRIAETTSFGGRRLLNGSFGQAAFQIGADAGEAVFMGLSNIRSDVPDMGGVSFIGGNSASASWKTDAVNNTLVLKFKTRAGASVSLVIDANADSDIEELATFINGQAGDYVSTSVNQSGQLQVFVSTFDMEGDLTFGGTLAASLGLTIGAGDQATPSDIDVTSVGGAQMAVGIVDAALSYVDRQRADLGAKQNRLQHTISNLSNVQENVAASNSRIRDTDYAKETTELTKEQILQQASTAILSQAQQLPQAALNLLK